MPEPMRYRFGQFTLDTDSYELRRGEAPIDVEPQVIELIALLVAGAGRMVSGTEINEKVWGGRVVSEAALSSRIKAARRVLGDDGKSQSMIRTIHGKGFRFVAPVIRGRRRRRPVGDRRRRATGHGRPGRSGPRPLESPGGRGALVREPLRDADQEYFSDGITTDLITHLSRHRWLAITARNTTFGYKGRAVDVRRIGTELDVDYVVEGSVQRAGERVRIYAHLVDAASGHRAWAERFDRNVSDIFALQDEITEKIAARVEPEIGYAERNRVVYARPANLKAWDCFHLGIHHFFRFTAEDNVKAQELLRRSRELDPDFGDAYAWWAYAVVLGMVYWDTPPTSGLLEKALAACDRALSMDGQNATFHALKARVLLARREYDRAIIENEAAIELNPTFAAAHCGLGDSLAYEGRYDESLDCFRRSIDLSPNDPQRWAFFTYGALALLFKGDYEGALQWTERAASLPNCQYWTTAHRAVALARLGRDDAARAETAKLLRENPEFCRVFARQKLFYLKRSEQIEGYLEGLEQAGVPEHAAVAATSRS
ncbi:MAG: tetratricopeptide repeat protein [Gammaproteobacteria bacterium]|nr:tetratricopeptide repeat protein [Gammaproteobacteria bacterium]